MTIGIDMRPLLAGPATGVGIHLRGLVQGLSELQREGTLQDTYVLCSTGFKKSSAVLDTVCIDSPFQRRHISIPNKILTLSWLLTRLPTMRQLFPEIDYWLLPNITLYPYGPSTRYAVLVHDLSFIHYGRWYSMKRRLWHYATKFRKLLSHAELLITVSQTTASILKELIPESLSKRVVVIPPATLAVEASATENDLSSKLPKQYLLYVGTLEPRKNIEACIAAYRSIAPKYPGLELILAGTYGWSVRRMLRSIKDDTSIHWLQYVSDAEKTMLYKHARVLVWPSLYEGFGFPPLESLRQGTPVVTSYRTSLPEVLGINALYVHPYNVGELAAVLDQLLAEGELPSLLQQMPPRYRERTWKQVASEYVLALTAKI